MTGKAHVDAVLAALRAGSQIPTHLLGELPDKPAVPYQLLTPPGGHLTGDDLEGSHADFDDYYRLTSVGATVASAMVAQQDALDRLDDVVLEVDGRSAHAERTSTTPFASDKSLKLVATNTHPVYVVDVYRVTSTPER